MKVKAGRWRWELERRWRWEMPTRQSCWHRLTLRRTIIDRPQNWQPGRVEVDEVRGGNQERVALLRQCALLTVCTFGKAVLRELS